MHLYTIRYYINTRYSDKCPDNFMFITPYNDMRLQFPSSFYIYIAHGWLQRDLELREWEYRVLATFREERLHEEFVRRD